MNPKVSIIILNWNGWRDTIECLESLQRLTYSNYQVIVVDNGSTNDSVERIKAWAKENLCEGHLVVEYTHGDTPAEGKEAREHTFEVVPPKARMVLIRNEENLGFTGGNNVAIHYALQRKYPADYVLLLNNDAKVERDCLMHLVAVDREVNAGIVGAVVMDDKGEQIIFARAARFPFAHLLVAPIARWYRSPSGAKNKFWTSRRVHGAAMLIRKDVLGAVYSQTGRYLNTGLFLCGEEMDFCFFARKAGYKSVVARDAVVYHKVAASMGGSFNTLSYYYPTRNSVLLANNLLEFHWKILFHLFYLPLKLGHILAMCLRRRTSVAKAIISGLFDGYRGITGQWKQHDIEALRG